MLRSSVQYFEYQINAYAYRREARQVKSTHTRTRDIAFERTRRNAFARVYIIYEQFRS